jgi:hypothetical protein
LTIPLVEEAHVLSFYSPFIAAKMRPNGAVDESQAEDFHFILQEGKMHE